MAIGLNADGEGAYRTSIPSGGAGTLTDGGFTNTFVGVWLYRPSATATYALTAGGAIIHQVSGAREVFLGFDSAGAVLADLSLTITFNSGGGAGTPYTFPAHAGDDFLDEWVYYFVVENSTDGQIAGYIPLSTLTPVTQTRANDNAGSQYTNTLLFGTTGGGQVVLGHYAYARARYDTGMDATDALTYAQSNVTIAGDWGFWPLADNADTGDDSGNGYTLTFNGTLSSESDPTLVIPAALSAPTSSPLTTAVTIGATTDQTSGTFYAVVDSAANLAGVTATQIKAGQKAAGTSALASGNAAVSDTSPDVLVSGLSQYSPYAFAVVQNNANGDSNVLTGTFQTGLPIGWLRA